MDWKVPRRLELAGLLALLHPGSSGAQAGDPSQVDGFTADQEHKLQVPTDYLTPGPFEAVQLPRLEHTCSSCFPACVGDRCLLRIDVTYPKGAAAYGLAAPYPLAIFTAGFLISSDAYKSYTDRLATWGYTVVRYDKKETMTESLDDVTSVQLLTDLINWCGTDPLMRRIADCTRIYLCGHSRGAKISALAAAADPRVAAMTLLDPVDNTVYAPLAPGFPSAVAALQELRSTGRSLPIAIIGAGRGADCAPPGSNYPRFFAAAPSSSWLLTLRQAGHLAFLDAASLLQRAVCTPSSVPDEAVRAASAAVMVAWAQVTIRGVALEGPRGPAGEEQTLGRAGGVDGAARGGPAGVRSAASNGPGGAKWGVPPAAGEGLVSAFSSLPLGATQEPAWASTVGGGGGGDASDGGEADRERRPGVGGAQLEVVTRIPQVTQWQRLQLSELAVRLQDTLGINVASQFDG